MTTTSSPLHPSDTAAVEALTRSMGDRHLTKTQRLEIAALIGEIFDRAAAGA